MSYQDLIARLEKATGPDRELDADICLEVGPYQSDIWERNPRHRHLLQTKDAKLNDWVPFPNYTASLDAALTLVPEGQSAQTTRYANHEGGAWVGDEDFVRAATPAIALCIAALKARQALTSAKDS